MIQITPLSDKKKRKIYKKMKRKELINMLIACQEYVEHQKDPNWGISVLEPRKGEIIYN